MNKHFSFLAGMLVIVGLIVFLGSLDTPGVGLAPAVTARLEARPLAEVSGMAKSRSYPNTF